MLRIAEHKSTSPRRGEVNRARSHALRVFVGHDEDQNYLTHALFHGIIESWK
jgi:hypothetical protein